MKNMISVIMPAYNAENTIEEAIQSILDQTYCNLELIICDDGSSDNTLKKINSFSDNRIIVLKNINNLGNLITTNRLLEEAKGDFIALQDADDYSSKDRLQKQINKILEKNVDLIGCNVGLLVKGNIVGSIKNPEYPLNFMNNKIVPIVWGGCLFKREIYDTIGGFDIIFNRIGAADFNWLQRASLKFNFYNLQEILYFYRQHSASVTKATKEIVIEKLYSEEIAYDIYMDFSKKGYYDFEVSKKIFENQRDYYKNIFCRDENKLLGIFYNDLQFNDLKYFNYLKKVFLIKTQIIIKMKYVVQGFLLKLLGIKNLERMKDFLR